MDETIQITVIAAIAAGTAVVLALICFLLYQRLRRITKEMKGMRARRETAATETTADFGQALLPMGLLRVLNLKQVSDISLKNSREVKGVILNADVTGFGPKLRLMEPQKAYELVNRIMEGCVPAVYEEGGEIIDFGNGGFEALYTEHYEAVLDSAVAMCEYMRGQEKRHEEYGEFSVGICYGTAMAGVVGHAKRMALSVLSVYTGLAEFLQSIATSYYAKILVTGSYSSLNQEFARQFNCRLLGYIYIRSEDRIEKIYDVFDGDPVEVRNQKRKTKTAFEKGIKVFTEGNYQQARVYFIEVLKTDQQDLAARRYVHLCEQNLDTECKNSKGEICIETY